MAGTGSTFRVHALKLHMCRSQFNPNLSKPAYAQRLCKCTSQSNPNLSKTSHVQKSVQPKTFPDTKIENFTERERETETERRREREKSFKPPRPPTRQNGTDGSVTADQSFERLFSVHQVQHPQVVWAVTLQGHQQLEQVVWLYLSE